MNNILCSSCNKLLIGRLEGKIYNLSHIKIQNYRFHHDCFRLVISQLEDGKSFCGIECVPANSILMEK